MSKESPRCIWHHLYYYFRNSTLCARCWCATIPTTTLFYETSVWLLHNGLQRGSFLTLQDRTTLQFPYNNGSRLPLLLTTNHFGTSGKTVGLTYQDAQTLRDVKGLKAFMNVADETNQNVTSSQKEPLLWHQRLGHTDF
jgi:hypothetical protein